MPEDSSRITPRPLLGYNLWEKLISIHKGLDPAHDNTYDYRGYYADNPAEAWSMLWENPDAHFRDDYKTVYHPTFSTQSKYSGIVSPYNPLGLKGGTWNEKGDTFIMSPDLYKGPVSMDGRINYLIDGEDNGVVLREPDGSLPYMSDDTFLGGVLPNVEVTPQKEWSSLSPKEKADVMKVAVRNGITDLRSIKGKYNGFALGGNLYGGGGHIYQVLPGLLRDAGLDVRVTSGYRKAGSVGTAGSRSWHPRHGAVDIVPQGKTTFEDIERVVRENPAVRNYLLSNGFGFLDETNRTDRGRALMKRTGATGSHFHFGRDTSARRHLQDFLGGSYGQAPTPSPVSMAGSNALTAMRYLMGKGLSQAQAAGMVGSLMGESGGDLDITAVNPTSGAYGIAQWLGPRKTALFQRYGKNPTLEQQLDYLWYELNTTHSNGLRYLTGAQSAADAADAAFGWYEFSVGPDGALKAMRDTGQNGSQRMLRGRKYAAQLMGQDYGDLSGGQGDISFAPWLTQPLDNRDLYGDMTDAPALQQPKGPTPEEIERAERARGTSNFFTVTLPNLNGQNVDQINDQINDLGLDILRLIKSNPGIKVPEMYKKLSAVNARITPDMIRNEIKRELKPYIKFFGSNKTGGYYLIDLD